MNLSCVSFRSKLSSIFSMTGLVASFNLEVGITGAILTKLDGDSRGGAALSVREVINRTYYSLTYYCILGDYRSEILVFV